MKRKLVNFEVFDRIEKDSLSQAEYELTEAQDVLADVLGSGPLTFRFFDKNKVVYDTDRGTHVHANFSIKNESITFDDITELVVDTESQRKYLRECVSKMVDAIIDGNTTEANTQFDNYMKQYVTARKAGAFQSMNESTADKVVRWDSRQGKVVQWGHGGPKSHGGHAAAKSAKQKSGRKKRNTPAGKAKESATRHKNELTGVRKKVRLIRTGSSEKKMLKEWRGLCESVNHYLENAIHGQNLNSTELQQNDTGDVVGVRIPTAHVRNENHVLSMQYKTLKTDVKVLREAARHLCMNESFAKTVSEMKRFNNVVNQQELEESINKLVTKHPNVLYLTQEELAKTIGQSLEYSGQTNYDDQICSFMAEGILRVAHNAYTDRVNRISQLANVKMTESDNTDGYEQFQSIVREFYPKLDEAMATEMQVYTDLYNALVEVHRLSAICGNEELKHESTEYLESLKNVLEGREIGTFDLAMDVSEFLQTIVESNLEGASDSWEVVKSPYVSSNGDFPALSKVATKPGHPGAFGDNWGGEGSPVSDGKSYKGNAGEMKSGGFGNKSTQDTYPSLSNPYSKGNGDYTMKGEKGVDKSGKDGFGDWKGDTYPELKNPYLLPAFFPKISSDNTVD